MSDAVDQRDKEGKEGAPERPQAVVLHESRLGPLGEILCLTIDTPPRNMLSRAVVDGMMQALRGFGSGDDAPSALIIAARGAQFSTATALDLAPGQEPVDIGPLCLALEGLAVPVIVALQGAVLGAGASLALAAHSRIAAPDLRFAFPEAGLGLIPGGGATQRLPRLVGAASALDLMLYARPFGAEEALEIGLIDRIASGDLLEGAVELALEPGQPRPAHARGEGVQDGQAFMQAIAQGRVVARRSTLPAPDRIVDCIEAALFLPFENGLLLESFIEDDLRQSPEAAGLVSAARAERRALTLPLALARTEGRAVARLGIVGSTPAALDLARMALSHGISVAVTDADPARSAEALATIDARMAAEEQAGSLTTGQRLLERARLEAGTTETALAGADLVIHAADGPAPMAQNRTLPGPLAGAVHLVEGGAPGFFGLALSPSRRLAELALSGGGAPAAAMTAVQFLRRLAIQPALTLKMPVVGSQLAEAGSKALAVMENSGVARADLAAALADFGMALRDLPQPDPAISPSPRRLAPAEIRNRWLGAMANAGFRLLDDGIARRPSDLDHIMVRGYGFPRWRGGPMHQAGLRGLMVLRSDLKRWAAEDAVWQAQPMIVRMIAAGSRLSELDL